MMETRKILQYKEELDKYTDVALITELYRRIVEDMTKEVADVEVSNFQNKKGYPITCSVCGKQATVPFKPAEDQRTPLKCRECWEASRK